MIIKLNHQLLAVFIKTDYTDFFTSLSDAIAFKKFSSVLFILCSFVVFSQGNLHYLLTFLQYHKDSNSLLTGKKTPLKIRLNLSGRAEGQRKEHFKRGKAAAITKVSPVDLPLHTAHVNRENISWYSLLDFPCG